MPISPSFAADIRAFCEKYGGSLQRDRGHRLVKFLSVIDAALITNSPTENYTPIAVAMDIQLPREILHHVAALYRPYGWEVEILNAEFGEVRLRFKPLGDEE